MEDTVKIGEKDRPRSDNNPPTNKVVQSLASVTTTTDKRKTSRDARQVTTLTSTTTTTEHRGNTKPRRRSVRPPTKRPNDVYISEKTSLKVHLERCKKLFSEENYQQIFLHGLGNTIPRTLNIALELKNSHYLNTVDFETHTSTVKLIDDLVPQDDITPASYSSRNVSAVRVRVFRTVNLA